MLTVDDATREISACVVGLGKLGLPLAIQFASNGIATIGVDTDQNKVVNLNQGICDFEEPGLTEELPMLVESRLFFATRDIEDAMSRSTHIVLVVPLDLDDSNGPDFSKIDAASNEIAKYIKGGQTIIVETTLPVGTTSSRIGPILEKVSGLSAGVDFYLAFSPERVSSGSMKMGFGKYPKLVGGVNKDSTTRAAALYERGFTFEQNPNLTRAVGVWQLESSEAAEFAKLAETTYRDVNIALANTFALASMKHGFDYLSIVEACNSQPFSHLHKPGISVGGHCIPVYPHLFLYSNDGLGLIESARRVNDVIPELMVEASQSFSKSPVGSKALVVGLCYRTGVRESAHSGAFQLKVSLERIGLEVELVDELFSDEAIVSLGFKPMELGSGFDIVFINSGSESYVREILAQVDEKSLIVDGRRTLETDRPLNYIRL
jgi:nucleotide sugar dehydrogenase